MLLRRLAVDALVFGFPIALAVADCEGHNDDSALGFRRVN